MCVCVSFCPYLRLPVAPGVQREKEREGQGQRPQGEAQRDARGELRNTLGSRLHHVPNCRANDMNSTRTEGLKGQQLGEVEKFNSAD